MIYHISIYLLPPDFIFNGEMSFSYKDHCEISQFKHEEMIRFAEAANAIPRTAEPFLHVTFSVTDLVYINNICTKADTWTYLQFGKIVHSKRFPLLSFGNNVYIFEFTQCNFPCMLIETTWPSLKFAHFPILHILSIELAQFISRPRVMKWAKIKGGQISKYSLVQ